MLRMRHLAAPLLAALVAACAQSPQAAPAPAPTPSPSAGAPTTPAPAPAPAPTPAPAPASAAGLYDFTTVVQGDQVTGTITIVAEGDRYSGTIATSATPEIPISSVTMEGQVINVTATSPDGEVVMQLTMQGQEFTGTWSYAGQSGTMTGRKRG
jgi:hypothetical protein